LPTEACVGNNYILLALNTNGDFSHLKNKLKTSWKCIQQI